jgi:hypothetical protein
MQPVLLANRNRRERACKPHPASEEEPVCGQGEDPSSQYVLLAVCGQVFELFNFWSLV